MIDFSNLQKLTIVILTYNRPKYLKRTIKYWLNYNIKLLIIDGSDFKLDDPILNPKILNTYTIQKNYMQDF